MTSVLFAVVRWPPALLAAVAATWAVALLAAPVAVVTGDVEHGLGWWSSVLYDVAGRICHQRVDRSWTWRNVSFPVCGRCLTLYVSGAVGAGVAAWTAWRAPWRLAWPTRRPASSLARLTPEAGWLALVALPAVLLLAVEWLVADPGTTARAVTAVPLGVLVGWICGRGLSRRP
jgi:hypothetical protein